MLTVRSESGAKNGWKMRITMGSTLELKSLLWQGEHINCLISGSIRTTPTLASHSHGMFLLDGRTLNRGIADDFPIYQTC